MSALLGFSDNDPRVAVLNHRPVNPKGRYVLYWMQMYRRGYDNAALNYAIEQANALGLPCVVYEGLRPDYPFASDRFHTFVVEGAADTAQRLRERGVAYAFFLPATADEARGVVSKLMNDAALVVSDAYPTFIAPAQNEAGAKRCDVRYVTIDDNIIVPLALFPKEEFAARTLRPKIWKAIPQWLRPLREAIATAKPPTHFNWPFEPFDFRTAREGIARCAIDHSVPAVAEFPGGSASAEKRLSDFVHHKLQSYITDRNDPTRHATSGLSPYLHFGALSARHVALAVTTWQREGGDELAANAFLEQLVVRRGLAFNYAERNAKHSAYAGVPVWARNTLEAHLTDKRSRLVTYEQLERAESPDPLWNAAQRELLSRGIVHNYARMLWGKLPLLWSKTPDEAHQWVVKLNDKFALDGRDPDGYTNISWCFGLHDRPWPERAIFGKVRSMTSDSARRKFDFDSYISAMR